MMTFRTPEERHADPYVKASQINSLLRCAICADDSGLNTEIMFGDPDKGIWQLLEVAERLSADLMEQVERMQREQRLGIYKREDAEQATEA